MVQHLDAGPRPLQQRFVSGQSLLRRVAEIRQQRKMKVLIPIGEMMDLQSFNETINAFQTVEHGGNDHHRAAIRRDAGGIIQSRERTGFQQERGEPVHQRHGQLTGTNQED